MLVEKNHISTRETFGTALRLADHCSVAVNPVQLTA
jgi:hypothetical protein